VAALRSISGDVDSKISNLTDEEAARNAAGGDQTATEYLLNKYKKIVNYKMSTFYIIGAEREDVFQEGMIGLLKAIRDFNKEKASFKNFAEVCIKRQILSAIRMANRKKHWSLNSYISFNQFDRNDENGENASKLETCLLRDKKHDPLEKIIDDENFATTIEKMKKILSKKEIEVAAMYIRGLSYDEIARKLKINRKSVDNAIQRVKNKMREKLEK
jgi:RNA polymerase sporulation-specific sigma factor